MNQLEWQKKSCQVFISGIPVQTPLSESEVKRELRNIIREWGELSSVRLIPIGRNVKTRCGIGQFVWSGNAIECIKYLHEREVSKNFGVSQKIYLSARQDRHGRFNEGPGFDRFAKKQLLNTMNAKVMAQKGFVEDIANSIGAESEAGKACNVGLFNLKIYNLKSVVMQMDPISIEDLEQSNESDNEEDSQLRPIIYKGNMTNEFRALDPPRQKLIHDLFQATKRDLQNLNSKTTESIHNNELDDRTKVAFGHSGARTQNFTMKDIREKQKKNLK